MLVESTRLGNMNVPEDRIMNFPQGMPGFPDEKIFAFLPYETESPFAFLQSTSEPNLTFLLVEPFTFFHEYDFKVDDEIVDQLGISLENPPQVFNVVSIREKTEEMTANLLAPVLINWRDQKAMQIVLEKTSYTTRHRLFSDELLANVEKKGE